MGSVITAGTTQPHRDAFAFILAQDFDGVVLTGTANPHHLAENIAAFKQAQVQ
jgi:aryl-alcohol dehydrogenase-like predicted oxidoreductase